MQAYGNLIKENIDYDNLLITHPFEQELIKGIYELILETVLCQNEEILIASNWYPVQLVKSKFLKLRYSHIEYVIECLKRTLQKSRISRSICWQHYLMRLLRLMVIIRLR